MTATNDRPIAAMPDTNCPSWCQQDQCKGEHWRRPAAANADRPLAWLTPRVAHHAVHAPESP